MTAPAPIAIPMPPPMHMHMQMHMHIHMRRSSGSWDDSKRRLRARLPGDKIPTARRTSLAAQEQ
eukprot:11772628-Heterocapsa_arctica.AAC.1